MTNVPFSPRPGRRKALLEHASVASFSRFSLALLSVGAPADLLEAAHRASIDEVRHAELCFALASAYAGEEVQPGAFPLGSHLDVDTSLMEIAVSTVREGCIGETIAAMRAAEQCARTTDPAVKAALSRIADDEASHAELAWKTVRWAVEKGGSEVREAVRAAFAQMAAIVDREASSPAIGSATVDTTATLERHGVLSARESHAVSTRAMAELVLPAARLLLRG